jgi:hypothetical protein
MWGVLDERKLTSGRIQVVEFKGHTLPQCNLITGAQAGS